MTTDNQRGQSKEERVEAVLSGDLCKKCKGPLVVGHFEKACPNCNRFQFQPCGICGTQRIFCCC